MLNDNLKKYYKETENSIVSAFNSGKNIVGLIHDTGIYNSLNAINFTNKNADSKVIYLVSNNSHLINIKNYINNLGLNFNKVTSNIKFISYSNLYKMYVNDQIQNKNNIKNINADILVIDDYDHINGEKWSLAVNKFISSHDNMKIIGLKSNSTNYEQLENIFSSNEISTYTIGKAISEGILNKPCYKANDEPVKELINELITLINSKVNDTNKHTELINNLKSIINYAKSKENILGNNIKDNGKYIYCCSIDDVEDYKLAIKMNEVINDIRLKNPNAEIEVYKSLSLNLTLGSKNKDAFYSNVDLNGNDVSNKIKIMFVANQYNESSYIPDLDGIIIDRKIKSNKVFNELIKSVMYNSAKDAEPMIIDLGNNYNHIKTLSEKYDYNVNNKNELDITLENSDIYFMLKELKKQITNKYKWENSYELLQNYYEKNGNINIPVNFKSKDGVNFDEEGYSLGEWLQKQRVRFEKLSSEQQNLLKKFNIKINEKLSWDDKYDLLEKFYINYNNINLGFNFKTIDGINYDDSGINLYSWCKNLKANQHDLTAEQKSKLDKVGFEFKKVITHHSKDEIINFMEDYFKEHSNSNIPQSYKMEDGFTLGRSAEYIKKNKDKLTEEQLSRLNNIGFNFNTKAVTKTFEESYNLLVNFYTANSHIDIKKGFKTNDGINFDENGFNLYNWVIKQRTKVDKLTDEQKYLLNSLGFKWNVKENEEQIIAVCIENNIDYKKYKDILSKYSVDHLRAKLSFIAENKLDFHENGLPEVLVFSNDELMDKYNISMNELYNNYLNGNIK